MKFTAMAKKIGRLCAGTTAAVTLAIGMVMPASAMSTTAATQATQLNHSSQAIEQSLTSSQWGGSGFGYGYYQPHSNFYQYLYFVWLMEHFGGGSGSNFGNQNNSVHNCRTKMAPINNNGGVVINYGNNSSC